MSCTHRLFFHNFIGNSEGEKRSDFICDVGKSERETYDIVIFQTAAVQFFYHIFRGAGNVHFRSRFLSLYEIVNLLYVRGIFRVRAFNRHPVRRETRVYRAENKSGAIDIKFV